jgi:hypothetical protein
VMKAPHIAITTTMKPKARHANQPVGLLML